MEIIQNIINKINKLIPNKELKLSEQEIKYIIKLWIKDNYPQSEIKEINFYHYIEEDDPQEKEKIGVKILKLEK
jgi:hypothetical protein